jgi:competence protein ComEC
LLFVVGMFVGQRTYDFDSPAVYSLCAALCMGVLYMVLRQGRPLWGGALMRVFLWAVMFLLGGSIMTPRWKEVNIPSDSDGHERTAILLSSPVVKPKTYMLRALVGEATRRGGVRNRTCMLYMQRNSANEAVSWQAGDTVRFRAKLESPGDEAFFGGASYGKYLLVQHIDGVGYVPLSSVMRTSSCTGVPSLTLSQRLTIASEHTKQHILQHIHAINVTQDEYALIAAMTLGEKSSLSRKTREEYSATGASHFLALSGMHLSILIMLLHILLPGTWRRGPRSRYFCNALLVAFTVSYVLLTGAPLSLLRAAGMLILNILLVPQFSIRPKADSLNTLLLTVFLILCMDPLSVLDIGFQLSVSALLGILLFTPYLTLSSQRYPWVKKLASVPATCIAAQLATAPLVAYYFHTFPTYFLVTGLWIAIISVILLPLLWTLILSIGIPVLNEMMLFIFRLTLRTHNTILGTIAQWPHAILPVAIEDATTLLLLYLPIAGLFLLFRTMAIRASRKKEESIL